MLTNASFSNSKLIKFTINLIEILSVQFLLMQFLEQKFPSVPIIDISPVPNNVPKIRCVILCIYILWCFADETWHSQSVQHHPGLFVLANQIGASYLEYNLYLVWVNLGVSCLGYGLTWVRVDMGIACLGTHICVTRPQLFICILFSVCRVYLLVDFAVICCYLNGMRAITGIIDEVPLKKCGQLSHIQDQP